MRIIFVLLLICGLATVGLGLFQGAENAARWSSGYALFEQLGDKDPLKGEDIRGEYDRLFLKRETTTWVSLSGALTSILAVIGLLQLSRSRNPRMAPVGPGRGDAAPPVTPG
jgi:hypothetical protein